MPSDSSSCTGLDDSDDDDTGVTTGVSTSLWTIGLKPIRSTAAADIVDDASAISRDTPRGVVGGGD